MTESAMKVLGSNEQTKRFIYEIVSLVLTDEEKNDKDEARINLSEVLARVKARLNLEQVMIHSLNDLAVVLADYLTQNLHQKIEQEFLGTLDAFEEKLHEVALASEKSTLAGERVIDEMGVLQNDVATLHLRNAETTRNAVIGVLNEFLQFFRSSFPKITNEALQISFTPAVRKALAEEFGADMNRIREHAEFFADGLKNGLIPSVESTEAQVTRFTASALELEKVSDGLTGLHQSAENDAKKFRDLAGKFFEGFGEAFGSLENSLQFHVSSRLEQFAETVEQNKKETVEALNELCSQGLPVPVIKTGFFSRVMSTLISLIIFVFGFVAFIGFVALASWGDLLPNEVKDFMKPVLEKIMAKLKSREPTSLTVSTLVKKALQPKPRDPPTSRQVAPTSQPISPRTVSPPASRPVIYGPVSYQKHVDEQKKKKRELKRKKGEQRRERRLEKKQPNDVTNQM